MRAMFSLFAAALSCLLAACASRPAPIAPEPPGMRATAIDGTITYRQRVALSPQAIVKIWLQDVSTQNAVPTILDEVEIRNPGPVPIAFRVRYERAQIRQEHRYTLLVKIYEGDRTVFLNATSYPVITQGCTDHCEVVLDMMN